MLRIATITALGLSLAACGGDDITDEDYDDVASATASIIAEEGGDVAAMEDALETASGEAPPAFTRQADGTYVGQRGQIDYTYVLTCSDATGVAQPECDGDTDEAQLVVSWNGVVDTARRYALLERSGDWTLSGLTQNVVTFDGAGTFAVDSEFEAIYRPVMRTMSLDYSAQYDAVTYDRTLRRPVGGSIDFQVDAARTESRRFRNVEASFTVDVDVTFAADGTATIVLDGERTYIVTLATGDVVPEENVE